MSVVEGELGALPRRVVAVARALAAFDARALFLWEEDGGAPDALVVRACSVAGVLSEHDHAVLPDLLAAIIDRDRHGFEGLPTNQLPTTALDGRWDVIGWAVLGQRGALALAGDSEPARGRRVAWLREALAEVADDDDLIVADPSGAVRAVAPGAAAALGLGPGPHLGRQLDDLTPAAITTRLIAVEPAEVVRVRVPGPRSEVVLTARRLPGPSGAVTVRVVPASRHDHQGARLEQLVAAVRHEVRTPLTVLRGVSSMLEEEPDMDLEDRVGFLRSLRRETQRVITLVEDLLTLARLETGQPLSRRAPLDLALWAEELLSEADPFCAEHRVIVHREFTAAPTPVEADRALLDQLGRSLLGHVLRDAPNELEITMRVRSDVGVALLELEDTAPPPASDEPFTSFKRSTATGKHAPGVGVGLHLAKKIADAHGWDLRVERDAGVNRLALRAPLVVASAGKPPR